ncbi:MAG: DNA integrity scanning diadenylate cyclase DisA [Coriobacteriia bacterium]|nr:DNA integrity scanning diadenylate cyclase DisA [Coriobacteriia bacterium]
MEKEEFDIRIKKAIRMTAPGTALRSAIDMILAGQLGALICIGDTDKVLAAGNDGFPLNISFNSHRLFELAKMDGAIVVDEDVANILRANFHLNPDPSLPTSETGMRHKTADRMSMQTDALVISISERRQVVSIYIGGKSIQLRSHTDLINEANQMLLALQTGRQALDSALSRLSQLEFDNYVTLEDVATVFARFQTLRTIGDVLQEVLNQMGAQGHVLRIQFRELTHGIHEQYKLAIRDYAQDASDENAERVLSEFNVLSSKEMTSPQKIAEILGYDSLKETSVMMPLGLRTLSRVSVVDGEMADKIVKEYGSLAELMLNLQNDVDRLEDMGISNPSILVDSLYRMWGKNL